VIAAVHLHAAPSRFDAWRDAEVVDGVLVDGPEAPPSRGAPTPAASCDLGLYDGSGRPRAAARFGRHVNVLA
jgi:hypothetical protein